MRSADRANAYIPERNSIVPYALDKLAIAYIWHGHGDWARLSNPTVHIGCNVAMPLHSMGMATLQPMCPLNVGGATTGAGMEAL